MRWRRPRGAADRAAAGTKFQQRVIELYHASGQRAAAIRQYERLTELLKSELGIAPSKNTRALVDGIRTERLL